MSASPSVSVVIPTHNPRMDYLPRVLDALRGQTLPHEQWELVVVDNASRVPLRAGMRHKADGERQKRAGGHGNFDRNNFENSKDTDASEDNVKISKSQIEPVQLDLGWHPNARVVREERTGLTPARLRGFAETKGDLIVLVDDDNVLDPDYLEQALKISEEFPFLGSWSGQSIPEFEDQEYLPHPLLKGFLQERHLYGDCWSNDMHHTASDPYGAGMCVRRAVANAYERKLKQQPERQLLDLQGETLLYGGDLDLAFAGLDIGLGKGVFKRLSFVHMMPRKRCETAYLLKAVEGHAQSQVLAGWLNGGKRLPTRRNWPASLLQWIRG